MQVRTLQGDTLDLLCWRHLGRTEAVVEAALERNPDLARMGVFLPAGLAVDLVDVPAAPRPTVKLWD